MAFTCCLDEDAKAQLRVSKAIERELDQWKRDSSREFKLLLLGMAIRPMIHRCGRCTGWEILRGPVTLEALFVRVGRWPCFWVGPFA